MAERRVVVVLDETVWRSLLVGWDSGPVKEQMERAQSLDDPALVERVARGMFEAPFPTFPPWNMLKDEVRDGYRENATAALAVLSGAKR